MVTEFISSPQSRERYAMAKRKRKELTLQEKVELIDFKNKNPATALRQIAPQSLFWANFDLKNT